MENLELIIDELIGSSEDIEDMYCKIGEDEYYFRQVECEPWEVDGKWQHRSLVMELIKNGKERLGIYYEQCQSRSGSPYSEYYWTYEHIERVKEQVTTKTITVKEWVLY